jgi:hypothetical protein
MLLHTLQVDQAVSFLQWDAPALQIQGLSLGAILAFLEN